MIEYRSINALKFLANYLWYKVEDDIKKLLLDIKHAKDQSELLQSISTQLSVPINWDLVYDELTAK